MLAKAPEVFIEPLDQQGVFRPDDDIFLDGDAFDLQDDDIFESQLEWRSNLAGVLGNGTPLLVRLPKGVHTITLTVTNTSVETVTITALTDTNALSAGCLALIGTTLGLPLGIMTGSARTGAAAAIVRAASVGVGIVTTVLPLRCD